MRRSLTLAFTEYRCRGTIDRRPDGRSFDLEVLMRLFVCLCLVVLLSGCGAISATSLRCGTDGESSYLELVSAPQNISSNTRAIGEMCAFAYEGDSE